MDYLSGRYDELTTLKRQRLAQYRYQVFVERLGWQLSTPDDFEFDQFDHSGTHYIVAEEDGGNIKGCARLLPTTSCDQYFAELALWFGLAPSDLPAIFPNLGNFYTYSAGTPPLGFLL